MIAPLTGRQGRDDRMIRYAAGRVLAIVPVLFGVSIVVFLLIRLIPGNPAIAILGERATPELVERVENQLGLDLPIWRQYLHFLGNASRGDFGASYFYKQEVSTLTLERIPITLALIAYAMVIGLVIAVPFANLAATPARGPRRSRHPARVHGASSASPPSGWASSWPCCSACSCSCFPWAAPARPGSTPSGT